VALAAVVLECHTLVVREPGAAKNDIVAAYAVYRTPAVELMGEWLRLSYQPNAAGQRVDNHGGYVQASRAFGTIIDTHVTTLVSAAFLGWFGTGPVRGFAVTGPTSDPDGDPVADGEISELTVDPGQTRHGHGSRLVQACADTLRADRFRTALVWLNATDDVRRAFLTEAGWAPDGAHRELDLHGDGSVRVKQVRLHTDLTEG
jgi:ribosomal protein S18 acetylase RimI-like enzyme